MKNAFRTLKHFSCLRKFSTSFHTLNISDLTTKEYDIKTVMHVLKDKRLRQRDLDRETQVVFTSIRNIKDIHSELDLDSHVDYLIEYFHDLNQNFRDI